MEYRDNFMYNIIWYYQTLCITREVTRVTDCQDRTRVLRVLRRYGFYLRRLDGFLYFYVIDDRVNIVPVDVPCYITW